MRLTRLGLLVPLFAAACGQSMQPFVPFDSGVPGDDLAAGGADFAGVSKDLKGADLFGVPVDGGCAASTGPTITFVKPLSGDFVSGVFEVVATVDDPCGVVDSSVIAEFGNNANAVVTLTRLDSKTFGGTFDVRTLAPNYVLAAISVRARDSIGLQAQAGEEVVVDIVKPWMTMNAAVKMYVAKHDPSLNFECSRQFAPLGSDATVEGQVVPQLITLRTRIEDHGNEAPGLAVERFSGVDPNSVQLFVIHDDGMTPLAVDTDNDTFCDDVNPLLIPTAGPVMMQNQALSLQMVPIPASGTPDYELQASTPPAGCAEVGDSATTMPPPRLCAATPLTFALTYPNLAMTPLPAIWTLPPVKAGDSADCVGFQLDAANQLPEGPACVITRAADNVGNVQVSFPLHICIDFGNNKCTGFTPTQSHCTGVYDKATMMLKAGTCTAPPQATPTMLDGPATFPVSGNEIRFLQ